MLKLKVLTDNNTLIDKYFTAEPGLSFWIESDGKKILFDTGYSDVFISNARIMGTDLNGMDVAVLSHGHNDHTWGLCHLVQHFDRTIKTGRQKLIAHPGAFERKRCGDLEIGMTLREDVLGEYFDITKCQSPVRITENLLWLGEIPVKHGARRAIGKTLINGEWIPDACYDDSALVYGSEKGIVIITGCSHSGICNVIDYAMMLTGTTKILDIIGGFHLQNADEETMERTLRGITKAAPETVHPCHCTDLKAKMKLSASLNVEEVGAGLELDYE